MTLHSNTQRHKNLPGQKTIPRLVKQVNAHSSHYTRRYLFIQFQGEERDALCCIQFQFNSILSWSSRNKEWPPEPFRSGRASPENSNKNKVKRCIIEQFPSVLPVPERHSNRKALFFLGGGLLTTEQSGAACFSPGEERTREETSHSFSHNWHRGVWRGLFSRVAAVGFLNIKMHSLVRRRRLQTAASKQYCNLNGFIFTHE